MAKFVALMLLLAATVAFPYGDTLKCYAICKDAAPAIDGSIADWNPKYKAGSLSEGDTNQIFLTSAVNSFLGWSIDYDYDLYLAHTDSFIYIGWKNTVDDDCIQGHSWRDGGDNVKLCFGGKNNNFYVGNSDTTTAGTDPDGWLNNPAFGPALTTSWIPNITACVHKGTNSDLPVYEIRMNKLQVGLPHTTLAKMAIINYLIEEADASKSAFLGLGGKYIGDRTASANNQWDAASNFPLTLFYETDPDGNALTGCPSAVEANPARKTPGASLTASPNPFLPSTTLRYSTSGSASLNIYDISGHLVRSFGNLKNSGSVNWDAKDASGKSVAAGVYVAKLASAEKSLSLRLLLAK